MTFLMLTLLGFFTLCCALDDPVDFLKRYGYLQTGYSNPNSLTEAIKKMQKFANLPETGVLDKPTLNLMSTPRCGISDHDHSGYSSSKWSKTKLTYKIINHTPDLGLAETARIMQEAFNKWSQVTPLTFTRAQGTTDLEIDFANLRHSSCSWDFDGPGGVLAHAFYPPDGRAHFDDDEHFTDKKSTGTNLLWVAAHEFGHAIGLTHSSVQGSLMFPYYQGYQDPFVLHENDVSRIQQLYGGRGGATIPPPKTTLSPVCTNFYGDEYCKGIAYGCAYDHWKDFMSTNCYKTCFCKNLKKN
ncbi:matrix metalloproteinase-27 isoform X1 [Hydra vulgaris]|uniref:matrix metalloproteinase-27 isoform X1 n=1 Tax=Hydra vulgaris TaxID=6087 RepID=UPI001F5F95F9|nr:matrix metalloproteinase-27 [Hydra vulgaris]